MSTVVTTETQCDLCCYRGRGQLFARVGGFDLCRWCRTEWTRESSCGGHTVTLADGSWSCTCGSVYGALVLRMRMQGVSSEVMAVVPDLAAATAAIHVQTPNWPQSF